MEALVRLGPGVHILLFHRRIHFVDRLFNRGERLFVEVRPSQPLDGRQLERSQNLVDLSQFLNRERDDSHPVAGNQLNEAFVLQPDQCLADRRPAHSEVGGQLLFEDVVPWGVVVVQNAPADFGVCLVDTRFALPAALLPPTGLDRDERCFWLILSRLNRHARYDTRTACKDERGGCLRCFVLEVR